MINCTLKYIIYRKPCQHTTVSNCQAVFLMNSTAKESVWAKATLKESDLSVKKGLKSPYLWIGFAQQELSLFIVN